MKAFRKKIDPRRYNGASLVGLNGIVVKSHGSADRIAFGNAIQTALIECQQGVPTQIIAVESGRPVPLGWEMGMSSYFPSTPEADGKRLHLLTKDRLLATLRDPLVGAVALSDHALGLLAKQSIFGYLPKQLIDEHELHEALPALRRFRLDFVFEEFGQFDDRLYVLLPAGH